jgi:hypothetical protein
MAGKRVATNGTMACPAHFPIIKHCHLFPEIKMFLGTAMISERKAVVTYTGETKTKSSKGPSNAQSEGIDPNLAALESSYDVGIPLDQHSSRNPTSMLTEESEANPNPNSPNPNPSIDNPSLNNSHSHPANPTTTT